MEVYKIIDLKDFIPPQLARDCEHANETYTKMDHFTVFKKLLKTM